MPIRKSCILTSTSSAESTVASTAMLSRPPSKRFIVSLTSGIASGNLKPKSLTLSLRKNDAKDARKCSLSAVIMILLPSNVIHSWNPRAVARAVTKFLTPGDTTYLPLSSNEQARTSASAVERILSKSFEVFTVTVPSLSILAPELLTMSSKSVPSALSIASVIIFTSALTNLERSVSTLKLTFCK